jgi:UDP-N-acetylglucosamine--N-acetylmuramyl-(pentapeptide) pyrophosphoryl-undecaprenol N-acetylglucosamine transferase
MDEDMANKARSRHAMLTGGGTGGHIFPALSVGAELHRRGWQVSFAGSPQGMEARIVPSHGVPFHALAARPVLGRGLLGKMRAAVTLARSAWQARRLVRRLGVEVLLGTGGYVSVPAIVGARLARRPVVLFEPNAAAGLANRTLSRWAGQAAVNYPATVAQFRCPAEVTGVPVREAFFRVPSLDLETARERRHLLVLGGSQGAQQLNRELPPAVARWAQTAEGTLRITHQCGERWVAAAEAAYREAGVGCGDGEGSAVTVEVVPFIDDVAAAMAAATLIVSRAGALTLAEICAAGRPSLLVPLAAALGHQEDNARELVTADAARLATGEGSLEAPLAELLADPEALVTMGAAARERAFPEAAARIADLVERAAGAGTPAGAQGGTP